MSDGTLSAWYCARDNPCTSPEHEIGRKHARLREREGRDCDRERNFLGKDVMKTQTLVIGYALALALFLFAQRRSETVQTGSYSGVVDLTHSWTGKAQGRGKAGVVRSASLVEHEVVRRVSASTSSNTNIDAPARLARGMWTVDQIPPERLIAPLVVIDVTKQVRGNADYELSVEDIEVWEQIHGEIRAGSVVLARTGWSGRWSSGEGYRNADKRGVMHFPGFSEDAAKFLVEGRAALALGIDTLSVDAGASKTLAVHEYTLAHSVYHLENVANLDRVPDAGAVVVVAPMKLEGEVDGPVRILALTRQ
jgi:kynurenine formamidase